jgi:hypothetical protein
MPEVISRKELFNGELTLLVFDDLEKKIYRLKGAHSGVIWEMLNGENTVDHIVDELYEKGSGRRETIVRDVCRFIARVGKKKLIKAAVKKKAS